MHFFEQNDGDLTDASVVSLNPTILDNLKELQNYQEFLEKERKKTENKKLTYFIKKKLQNTFKRKGSQIGEIITKEQENTLNYLQTYAAKEKLKKLKSQSFDGRQQKALIQEKNNLLTNRNTFVLNEINDNTSNQQNCFRTMQTNIQVQQQNKNLIDKDNKKNWQQFLKPHCSKQETTFSLFDKSQNLCDLSTNIDKASNYSFRHDEFAKNNNQSKFEVSTNSQETNNYNQSILSNQDKLVNQLLQQLQEKNKENIMLKRIIKNMNEAKFTKSNRISKNQVLSSRAMRRQFESKKIGKINKKYQKLKEIQNQNENVISQCENIVNHLIKNIISNDKQLELLKQQNILNSKKVLELNQNKNLLVTKFKEFKENILKVLEKYVAQLTIYNEKELLAEKLSIENMKLRQEKELLVRAYQKQFSEK